MKRRLTALLLLLCLLLTGCDSVRLDRQAMVLCLALDEQEGKLLLTARFPKLSQGGGEYATLAVKGDTLPGALEQLRAATPFILNYTNVRLIALSEELARQTDLLTILEPLLMLHGMDGGAGVLVARGSAGDLIDALQPDFGNRLSKHIELDIATQVAQGFIPRAALAQVVRDLLGGRQDPLLLLGAVNPSNVQSGQQSEQSSSGSNDEGGASPAFSQAGQMEEKSDNPAEIQGAALTSGGRVVGVLSGEEMQCVALLQKSSLRVHVGDVMQLQAVVRLSSAKGDAALQAQLEDILQLLKAMQSDPLAYEEIAARAFLTDREWAAYDFASRYRSASVAVRVE